MKEVHDMRIDPDYYPQRTRADVNVVWDRRSTRE